jgi:hypothetical protein
MPHSLLLALSFVSADFSLSKNFNGVVNSACNPAELSYIMLKISDIWHAGFVL